MFGLLSLVLALFVVMQLVNTQTKTPPDSAVRAAPSVADPSAPQRMAPPPPTPSAPAAYQRSLDAAQQAGQQRLDAADQP